MLSKEEFIELYKAADEETKKKVLELLNAESEEQEDV